MPRRKNTTPEQPKDKALAYCEGVLNGSIPAGKPVQLACKRHVEDLQHGESRGIYFDSFAANHALDFFKFLRHHKGEWAGREFELSPWQEFIIASIFGWKRRENGYRRFRTSYIEVPRKAGKSHLAAGVALYMLFADGEPGAEIYSAATKKEQAAIVFDAAKHMVEASPPLRKKIGVAKNSLFVLRSNSKFLPLGADANTLDGLNIHCAIVDELHEHRNRDVWDKLATALGARRQPLIFAITTAGDERKGICWEMHEHSLKVLEGVLEDDARFAYIATMDEADDWTDERTWFKANPGLGVSVKVEFLRDELVKARAIPSEQNAFLRMYLDIWTEKQSKWLDIDYWYACDCSPVDPDKLKGKDCYAGLDLSSTEDITALVLFFPETQSVLPFFWVPRDNIIPRRKRDNVPYDTWVNQGLIFATEGNTIDYDAIIARILDLKEQYNILEIAYDPYNAHSTVNKLQSEGVTLVPFRQGFLSMSAPTKETQRQILNGEIHHGDNPVLRWMFSNVVIQNDPQGNIKCVKDKSRDKIDGIIGLIMAIGRATLQPIKKRSVYAERGLLVLEW